MVGFKIGDKITLVGDLGKAARVGATGTIKSLIADYPYIVWDKDNPLREGQRDGLYCPEDFQLLSEREPTDEELAAQLRESRVKVEQARRLLEDRGWEVRYLSLSEDYKITRTREPETL